VHAREKGGKRTKKILNGQLRGEGRRADKRKDGYRPYRKRKPFDVVRFGRSKNSLPGKKGKKIEGLFGIR